jgi:NADPH:quinone reductase-like Zn-dependent oxidoreductase
MKAVVMKEYGGPEVLNYGDFSDPTPGPGEVLLKVAAASINPVDLKQRAGATRAYFPLEFPNVIGWDVSGTVMKLGPDVCEFAVGDRVFAWAFHTYAELCVVKTSVLAKIPEGIDLIEAAALPLVTMTGSQLISQASGVRRGQSILVSGAVGSVARAAVCTAKDQGPK